MGYCHYWYREPEIDKMVMSKIIADFNKVIFNQRPTLIEFTTEFSNGNSGDIGFNGFKPHDFEPVIFNRVCKDVRDGKIFCFCKTQYRPYDLDVIAFLIIARKHLGDHILVSSDGDDEQWAPARELCQTHLGYGNEFRFTPEHYLDVAGATGILTPVISNRRKILY